MEASVHSSNDGFYLNSGCTRPEAARDRPESPESRGIAGIGKKSPRKRRSATRPKEPSPGFSVPLCLRGEFWFFPIPRDSVRLRRSIQEILAVERIAALGDEAGVADHAAQLFLGSAVGHAGGAHDILLEHD